MEIEKKISNYLKNILDMDTVVDYLAVSETKNLIVILDRKSGLQIDDLALISRELNNYIDKNFENYFNNVEVSSRGINTELKTKNNWNNQKGRKVKFKIKIDEKYLSVEGRIKGITDDSVHIEIVEKINNTLILNKYIFDDILNAKIVPDFNIPPQEELELSGYPYEYVKFKLNG